ncbi:PrpR N-terminal domain-containing protein [Paenibacillus solisilvae]|uniref:PrpR N-terminal domain-containing protein n=1 Tax=Paenibacillus solisilvae TaxID=2486751 RepID=A0ABW0W7B8_9BACL
MKIKVLAIAPYPGLKGLLESISLEDSRIEMDIEVADLQNAIPIVDGTKGQSYDVILSRGGTSSVIRQHVSTPVVDIPVSGYDILRVLTLVKDSNTKVAIIGFPNICRGAAAVSSLLDFEIPIYSIEHESEAHASLQKAFEHGVKIVLGDAITVRTAEEMGYNGILITSGRESVLEALSEVKRIYDVILKAQENERFFEHILEHHRTGVLALDNRGVIRYANHAASLLLGYDNSVMRGMNLAGIDPAWGRYLEEVSKSDVTSVNKQKTKWFHKRQLKIEIVVPSIAIEHTYLVYMYPQENSVKNPVSSVFEVSDRIATFAQVIGSSFIIQQTIKRAKALAQTDKPIWITGEAGSGKRLFSQAIHSASKQNSDGLYVLPCSTLTETEQESILFGTDIAPGLLYMESVGTICLQEIQHVSQDLQRKLLAAVQAGTHTHLIVTSLLSIKILLKKEEMLKDFVKLFADTSLHLPPLRERLEDIGEIARVLIANYNSRHGKQIVGIRQEVLEEDLLQKLWPGNIHQLKIVLECMLSVTNGNYIGIKEAREGWLKVKETLQTEAASHSVLLNLSGTWEEIEKRVLWEILQNEGMNQSKTANRLGINRSTLWRKLKNMLQY